MTMKVTSLTIPWPLLVDHPTHALQDWEIVYLGGQDLLRRPEQALLVLDAGTISSIVIVRTTLLGALEGFFSCCERLMARHVLWCRQHLYEVGRGVRRLYKGFREPGQELEKLRLLYHYVPAICRGALAEDVVIGI